MNMNSPEKDTCGVTARSQTFEEQTEKQEMRGVVVTFVLFLSRHGRSARKPQAVHAEGWPDYLIAPFFASSLSSLVLVILNSSFAPRASLMLCECLQGAGGAPSKEGFHPAPSPSFLPLRLRRL